MKSTTKGMLRWLPIALMLLPTAAFAQQIAYHGGSGTHTHTGNKNVDLHINTRWSECSFQLDPSLTQRTWRQFTGEAGVVTYFRPLMDAAPMGAGKFEVSVLQWKTGIDDTEDAWNDTFVHPDSTHWLFEGNGLAFPGLTVRAGVTDRTDVGAYFTLSPGANYGFYGAQLQQNLLRDTDGQWFASARTSYVAMFGPEDMGFAVYGVDVVTSRRYSVSRRLSLSPYAVVSTSLSRSREKSAVVDLEDENVLGAHATVGAVARLSAARIGVEYAVARVPSFSLKVGFGRGN